MTGLFDLTGKVAIVTGGNGGIGLGMARGLAGAGAKVVIAARDPDKTAAAIHVIEQAGGEASAIGVDVRTEASVKAMIEAVVDRHGRIDILVNNAGINIRKPPHVISPAEWKDVVDTSLTSTHTASHHAYPVMKSGGGGKIINIGSMMSIFGASFAPAYGAAKGGIVQYTKACAVAWAPDNIQVNCLLPGWIDTALTKGARRDVPGLNERVLARSPTGRWGVPDDFQGVAVFLASPASDFITGTAIPVDGGWSVAP